MIAESGSPEIVKLRAVRHAYVNGSLLGSSATALHVADRPDCAARSKEWVASFYGVGLTARSCVQEHGQICEAPSQTI